MTRITLIVLWLVTVSFNTTAAELYKWTDSKGVTHFSEKPPQNQASEKITTKSSRGQLTPESQAEINSLYEQYNAKKNQPQVEPTDLTGESTDAKFADLQAQRRKENCEIAKSNVDKLNSKYEIEVPSLQGDPRILTQTERQQWLERSEKEIQEFCF